MSNSKTDFDGRDAADTHSIRMDEVRGAIAEALFGAGKILTRMFTNSYKITHKEDGSLVTEADLAADQFIARHLSKHFPEIPVDSEEGRMGDVALAQSQMRWIVDPLDGTENFATLNPHFSSAIGLISSGKFLAGGILQPFSQILCSFETGRDALLNGQPFARVEAATSMRLARIAFIPTKKSNHSAFAHHARATIYRLCHRLVDNWAPSLDWCGLSAGRIDAVVSFGEAGTFQEFDALIGKSLFQQAWGRMGHIEQRPIDVDGTPNVLEIASTSASLIQEIRVHLMGE